MQVTRTLPVRFPHIHIFCNETVSENLDACKEKYAVLLQAATNNDERERLESCRVGRAESLTGFYWRFWNLNIVKPKA